ncbi:hypothetical protein COX67_05430, partial [Candidatus Falkowbacteria bacterium CG_4_10_14_0_2_um_filter_36_22]
CSYCRNTWRKCQRFGVPAIIYFPIPSKPYLFFRKISGMLGVWKFSNEVPLKSKIVAKEMSSLGFTTIKYNIFWKYFLTEDGIIFNKSTPKKTFSL